MINKEGVGCDLGFEPVAMANHHTNFRTQTSLSFYPQKTLTVTTANVFSFYVHNHPYYLVPFQLSEWLSLFHNHYLPFHTFDSFLPLILRRRRLLYWLIARFSFGYVVFVLLILYNRGLFRYLVDFKKRIHSIVLKVFILYW